MTIEEIRAAAMKARCSASALYTVEIDRIETEKKHRELHDEILPNLAALASAVEQLAIIVGALTSPSTPAPKDGGT